MSGNYRKEAKKTKSNWEKSDIALLGKRNSQQ